MTDQASNALTEIQNSKAVTSLAETYETPVDVFIQTVRSTAMPDNHTMGELMSCLLVAKDTDLNVLRREIYFMRTKSKKIQAIVGVDGWIRKCNEHPQFDGVEFKDNWDGDELVSVTCTIHRKDRTHPTTVTEYLRECKRDTDNWKTMPARMLRHRALIQCSRIAFGFAGLMDRDEFDAWQEREPAEAIDITPDDRPASDLPEPPDIPEEIPVEPVVDIEAFIDTFESAVIAASNHKELQEVWDVDADRIENDPELLERAQALYDARHEELAQEREALEAAE